MTSKKRSPEKVARKLRAKVTMTQRLKKGCQQIEGQSLWFGGPHLC